MQSWLARGSTQVFSKWHSSSSSTRTCCSISNDSKNKPPAAPIIQAIARRKDWKRAASFYRARGLVSAVICDPMPSHGSRNPSSSMLVFLKEQQITSILRTMGHRVFMSTVFIMRISNSLLSPQRPVTFTQRVLPRTVNFDDPEGITNIRFIKADAGVKLRLNCPIVFAGVELCRGIKKGGTLLKYHSYLPLSCVPEMLPTIIEVDIQNLDIGERILARDVECKVELHPDLDPDAPICKIAHR